ncbi:MAG TPA: 2-oxoglutarate oxidoreductase, partial [Firmicutes bacterium]|nr:2-oxoglutarate oxidoreductase [Bacillota bacterium]
MKKIFAYPRALSPKRTHYCPGCTHGVIHKLVAESMVELGILGDAIGVAPVGCSGFAFNYFNCDM